jgi:osmotically-inducible protein OsmY
MTVTCSMSTDPRIAPPSKPRPGIEIAREVERRLRSSGHLALLDVSAEVHAGTVRLRGHLPTYYLKQVAQSVVGDIAGVSQVVNQIAVLGPAGHPPLGRDRDREVTPDEGPHPS